MISLFFDALSRVLGPLGSGLFFKSVLGMIKTCTGRILEPKKACLSLSDVDFKTCTGTGVGRILKPKKVC
jgi:hypothetical protein